MLFSDLRCLILYSESQFTRCYTVNVIGDPITVNRLSLTKDTDCYFHFFTGQNIYGSTGV